MGNTSKPKVKAARSVVSNLTTRTRDEELFIIKALLDTLAPLTDEDAIHEILVATLTEHPWMAVYMRAALDPNRIYGLRSKHLKHVPRVSSELPPKGFFVLLTELQFEKLTPRQAIVEWRMMLQTLQPESQKVANMILNKKFGGLSRLQCVKAMKACKISPTIRKKVDETE